MTAPWDQPVDVGLSFVESALVVGALRSSRETYQEANETETVEEIDAIIQRLVDRFDLPIKRSWA